MNRGAHSTGRNSEPEMWGVFDGGRGLEPAAASNTGSQKRHQQVGTKRFQRLRPGGGLGGSRPCCDPSGSVPNGTGRALGGAGWDGREAPPTLARSPAQVLALGGAVLVAAGGVREGLAAGAPRLARLQPPKDFPKTAPGDSTTGPSAIPDLIGEIGDPRPRSLGKGSVRRIL